MTAIESNLPLTLEARMFAEKAARSVSEIQHGVNNIADVVVFLEILGYDDRVASRSGFASLTVLAKYVYNFLDHYENPRDRPEWTRMGEPVEGKRKRLLEALAVQTPWLGALVILNIMGFSLWMAQGLPADVTISYVSGVFLGLFITEGPLQMFSRLFYMYHEQRNVGETKRSVKRSYAVTIAIMAITAALVLAYSTTQEAPAILTTITLGAMATVGLHRLSFNIIFTLKKLRGVFTSYASAFIALALTYYIIPAPDVATRYFTALGVAFVVLSIFAARYHYKIVTKGNRAKSADRSAPAFYAPPTTTEKTVNSRFGIQLWESLPFALYGTAYFIMLLGDRVLSWIFNPHVVIASNGELLAMTFNAEYHVGADIALLALIPAAIVQYMLMAPLYSSIHNRALDLSVGDAGKLDQFLRSSYRRMILLVLLSAGGSVGLLNLFGPEVINYFNGTEDSLQVMRYASMGNIALSVFTANALIMMFLNRAKIPAIMAVAGAVLTMVLGSFLAQEGFEDIALGYAIACAAAAGLSFAGVQQMLKGSPVSNLLARYS